MVGRHRLHRRAGSLHGLFVSLFGRLHGLSARTVVQPHGRRKGVALCQLWPRVVRQHGARGILQRFVRGLSRGHLFRGRRRRGRRGRHLRSVPAGICASRRGSGVLSAVHPGAGQQPCGPAGVHQVPAAHVCPGTRGHCVSGLRRGRKDRGQWQRVLPAVPRGRGRHAVRPVPPRSIPIKYHASRPVRRLRGGCLR